MNVSHFALELSALHPFPPGSPRLTRIERIVLQDPLRNRILTHVKPCFGLLGPSAQFARTLRNRVKPIDEALVPFIASTTLQNFSSSRSRAMCVSFRSALISDERGLLAALTCLHRKGRHAFGCVSISVYKTVLQDVPIPPPVPFHPPMGAPPLFKGT